MSQQNNPNTPPIEDFEDLETFDNTYDEYGVNTKNSFNTPPKGE